MTITKARNGAELVEQWYNQGRLTPDKILDRLSQETFPMRFDNIASLNGIVFDNERETEIIREKFNSVAVDSAGGPRITREGFVGLLRIAGELPSNDDGTKFGAILFESLVYLSRYPFPSRESLQDVQAFAGITWDEFQRSIMWLLCVEQKDSFLSAKTGYSDDSRFRTPADWRRLVFQSLATTRDGKDVPHDVELARKLSLQDAQAVEDPTSGPGIVLPNNDEDGDEIFHDFLQVLVCTEPDIILDNIWRPIASRADFLPMARRLYDSEGLKLHHMSIPRDRLKVLFKGLLPSLYSTESRKQAELAGRFPEDELEQAAQSVTNAFCDHAQTGVTWLKFNQTFRRFMSTGRTVAYLLDPIRQIIPHALIGRNISRWNLEFAVLPNDSTYVLNPAAMAECQVFLYNTAALDLMRCVYRSRSEDQADRIAPGLSKIESITGTFINVPEGSVIIALSGFLRNSKHRITNRYTFVAFLVDLAEDGHVTRKSGTDEQETNSLIQLSPRLDIFRAIEGERAWAVDDGDLCFGSRHAGTALVIRHDLSRCVFSSKSTRQDGQSYEANNARGDWEVELEIDNLEVWCEVA